VVSNGVYNAGSRLVNNNVPHRLVVDGLGGGAFTPDAPSAGRRALASAALDLIVVADQSMRNSVI